MSKGKRHIILKITNTGIFYNQKNNVAWEKSNFPPKHDFTFNDQREIYWEVEMIFFQKKSRTLEVSVTDYHPENWEVTFHKQQPKTSISHINFKAIIWQELEPLLNSYRKKAFHLSEFILEAKKKPVDPRYVLHPDIIPADERVSGKKVSIQLKVPLMKTKFKMGCVEYEKKMKGFYRKLKIIIENPHIIPEFDHIKPFFMRVLQKRKIEIKGYAIVKPTGDIEVNCHSKDINRINTELITTVKRLKLRESVFKPVVVAVDKNLFTPDEFLESLESNLGNTFRKNEKDLLNDILELEGIRNRKQLIYLSGKLQSSKSKLRFTLNPTFGFLFHVDGQEMDHFIWELLNTHATYIWSTPKDGTPLDFKYKKVEREINFIRDHGRRQYLSNQQISSLLFHKINHAHAGLADGFPRWKMKVEEVLL